MSVVMRTLAHRCLVALAVTCLCDAEVTKVDAEIQTIVARLMQRKGKEPPSRREMIETGLQKVDPDAAVKRVQSKLPDDVASLVRTSATIKGKSRQPFDEDSLAKARKYLNEMMEAAWEELDNKVIECKEFEDRNRGHFEQIMTDIARLGEQIADLQRVISETVEFINTKDLEIISVQAKLKEETTIYLKIYYENSMEMTIRRNDLAVFQFMLKLTKCKSAAALLQLDKGKRRGANMCNTAQGVVFDFEDKKTQEELERMMTPSARAAVRQVLARVDMVRANQGVALLQEATQSAQDDDSDASGDGPSEESASENGDKESKALSALEERQPSPPPPKKSVPTPPVPKEKA